MNLETDRPPNGTSAGSSARGADEVSLQAFILRLVHDLRSPLNASLMWLDVLGLKEQSAETRKAIDAIRRSIDGQARLLRDLGDAAAYAADPIDLTLRRVGVDALMQHVAAAVAASCPGCRMTIGATPGAQIDVDVDGVARSVALIVAHLAGAAGGRVEVHASIIDAQRFRVTVTSGDATVDAQTLRALAQPPWRRPHKAYEAKGLGLGIFIAERVVAAHGGALTVADDPPTAGATVHVELPIAS